MIELDDANWNSGTWDRQVMSEVDASSHMPATASNTSTSVMV